MFGLVAAQVKNIKMYNSPAVFEDLVYCRGGCIKMTRHHAAVQLARIIRILVIKSWWMLLKALAIWSIFSLKLYENRFFWASLAVFGITDDWNVIHDKFMDKGSYLLIILHCIES